MIIIAFSNKTSKFIPRIFCGQIKHVAPIIVNANKMILHQFIRRNKIEKLEIKMRDISVLGQYGWRFIFVPGNAKLSIKYSQIFTCVQLSKQMLGIKDWRIQTPYALYKRLKNLNYYYFWGIMASDF